MLHSRQKNIRPTRVVDVTWGIPLSAKTKNVRSSPRLEGEALVLNAAAFPPVSDAELHRWFAREVVPLEPNLLRFLKRNWRNAAEVEDLKQDAFVRVWNAARRERPVRVKAFVYLVLRNIMTDRLRQQRLVRVDFVADLDRYEVHDEVPNAETQLAARQDLRVLQGCLDGLSPRTRQIVLLRRVDGCAQREVAKLLGVTEETVEHQLAIGIRKVKSDFASQLRRPSGGGYFL